MTTAGGGRAVEHGLDREVKFCHMCGTKMHTMRTYCATCGASVGSAPSEIRYDSSPVGAPVDKAGVGRYVLSFILAGFIGLGIQYLTRNYGWMGVIINGLIFMVIVGLLIVFAPSTESCYDQYGNYVC